MNNAINKTVPLSQKSIEDIRGVAFRIAPINIVDASPPCTTNLGCLVG